MSAEIIPLGARLRQRREEPCALLLVLLLEALIALLAFELFLPLDPTTRDEALTAVDPGA